MRGVAYRCSFRVTEAYYLIERIVDVLAHKLKIDPAELRLKSFIQPAQFPYQSALGWKYDSGDYPTAMRKAMVAVGYEGLRQEQEEKRAALARGEGGELMAIDVAFFTEIVGAGPTRNCDILGMGMFDSCEIQVHPTGSAIARLGTKSQGQAHETTYAQILATEIGIPSERIQLEEGQHRHRVTVSAPTACAPAAGVQAAGRRLRKQVRTYASNMFQFTAEATAERARKARDQGFTAVKFGWEPFGRDARTDCAYLDTICAAVGDEMDIMLDVGLIWEAKTTLQRAEADYTASTLHRGGQSP